MSYCAPTYFQANQQRAEIRKWINSMIKDNLDSEYYHVTLTFHQCEYKGGIYHHVQHDIKKIMSLFESQINRKVFGNAASRHDKRIFYLASIEHGVYGNNTHAHMILGFPKAKNYKKNIETLINESIAQTPRVNVINDVGQLKTENDVEYWTNYILKEGFNPEMLSIANY